MRVLMTADAVGGVWTYALDLIAALDDVEVVLAVMGPSPDDERRRRLALSPVAGVHERAYDLEWQPDPWPDVERAGRWLLGLERRYRPDLIHLNGYCHGSLPWRAPVVMAAHSCVLSWWEAVKGEPAPARFARYRHEVAAGLQSADVVVAPTAWMGEEVRRLYQVDRPVLTIANGRDPLFSAPAAKQDFLLVAGRLDDEAKNGDAVARIAPLLPWPVVTTGGGPARAGVVHRGFIAPGDLSALMAEAAIAVLPARYEPFGLTALESAMAGCALVLGDIASLREVWGDAAVYVDPGDDDAIASGVLGLIGDVERRIEMGRRAFIRSAALDRATMAAAYRRLYQRVSSRGSRCAS
jgi:glycosyltransferase involved in cell wall biosynthesis